MHDTGINSSSSPKGRSSSVVVHVHTYHRKIYAHVQQTAGFWLFGVGRKFILVMWALHLIHVHPPSGASPARIVPESPSDEPELQWFMPLLLQRWICGLQNPIDLVQYSLQLPSYFEGWKDSWLSCGVLKWTGLCSKARKLIGLIYCCFYQHSSPESLCQMYLTLVQAKSGTHLKSVK